MVVWLQPTRPMNVQILSLEKRICRCGLGTNDASRCINDDYTV